MSGRVYQSEFFTENEAKALEGWAVHMEPGVVFPNEMGLKLLATVINLHQQVRDWKRGYDTVSEELEMLREQNIILDEALRQIDMWSPDDEHIAQLVHRTLAKVKDGES